jgi:hypothetical protein
MGFRMRRVIVDMARYWSAIKEKNRDSKILLPQCKTPTEDEKPEVDFNGIAAVVISLGRDFDATKVRPCGWREGYSDFCFVYCRRCRAAFKAAKGLAGGPLTREEKNRCNMFGIYCRQADFGGYTQARFLVTFMNSCRHTAWLWFGTPPQGHERAYYLKCEHGVTDIKRGAVRGYRALHPLGVWMRDEELNDDFARSFIEQSCFSKPWMRHLGHYSKSTHTLEAFVHRLLRFGWVRIRVTETSERPLQWNGHDVLSLTFIPWWAFLVHENCDYLQLDASFRPTKPYVYTVPQALYSNEAIPLGFAFAPSESCFLYDTFFADLQWFFGSNVPLAPKSVLCDGGLALALFCLNAARKRFACHRHLIEAWAAGYYTGGFTAFVCCVRSARSSPSESASRSSRRPVN